jgi:biopolymer transport protein ExbD
VDFRRHISVPLMTGIDLVPLLNVIFLVVVFFLLVSVFAVSAPLKVKLPRAVTSDMVNGVAITIIVTSENILYINDRVVTLQELKDVLARAGSRGRAVMIKADRRASVGRVVDIWDLGRNMGVERINVATDQEE